MAIAGVTAGVSWLVLTRPHLPPAERGRRLAEKMGCFACHGPEGSGGTFNPGRAEVKVPNWSGDLMMFAHDSTQTREWIHDGVTEARAKSESYREQRKKGVLKMPGFGRRLTSAQIDDLVAYVLAVNKASVPEDTLAHHGMNRADSLGCFGCHGTGGRLARNNPHSFKGYIPSWNGQDFPDLVENRAEFDEWVNKGISTRFENNRLARYFLDRAVLKMPAYHDHLNPGDLDALWAYVEWLRSHEASTTQTEATK